MDSFLSLFGPTADDGFTVDDNDDDCNVASTLFDPHQAAGSRRPHQNGLSAAVPPQNKSCPKTRTNHQRSGDAAAADEAASSHHGDRTNGGTVGRCPPPMQSPSFDGDRLPPEPQLGNVEYKLKLVEPTAQRFEHLVTQMKWRLREGNGEAIYEIGVSDSGHLHGLPEADMAASLHTLRRMAAQLGATTTVLRRQRVPATPPPVAATTTGTAPTEPTAADSGATVAEVLVRKVPDDQHSIEVRCAVLGSAGAGKSTLLGVLTQGERDNGRGRARLNMFRHMHEIRSGRTSCISHETLGFDHTGAVLNYAHNCDAEALSERASKLVSFMDLAGHRRYMRTTVQALTGYGPHQAMLVVGSTTDDPATTDASSTGPPTAAAAVADDDHRHSDDTAASPTPIGGMAREHLNIVLALGLPFFIVVTKIDAAAPAQTLLALQRMLTAAGCRRVPLPVRTVDDVLTAAARQLGGQVVPIFCVSSVSGDGLELLTRFLHVLPPGISAAERERLEGEPAEFRVDEVFRVPDAGGPVLGGLQVQGVLAAGERMRLGPMADGRFVPVRVRSMHRNKAPCRAVRAGQSASLLVQRDGAPTADAEELALVVRSGMVLVPMAGQAAAATAADGAMQADGAEADEPYGSWFFQAKVSVLFHATAICEGFQTTVHIGSIRQTAVIEGIMGSQHLGTNDSASVLFRFVCHPEYVQPGMRILFREGTSKGVGHVTQVFPLNRSEA